MTETQIQYFLVVAKEQSISRAAEILFVSQPAVSKQLSLLEKELGVQLFERKGPRIRITDTGLTFENLFLDFKCRFSETLQAAQNSESKIRGVFRLGSSEGWNLSSFYHDLCQQIEGKYPDVEMHFSSLNHDQILYSLRRGEVDAVITMGYLFTQNSGLIVRRMFRLGTILLFSARHPLAEKPDLRLSDFKDCPFFLTALQGVETARTDIISACKSAGFTPKFEYVQTLPAAYMKIQLGNGVLLGADWLMGKSNAIFKHIPVDFKRDICLVSLPDVRTPLQELMMHEILVFFKDRFSENQNENGTAE